MVNFVETLFGVTVVAALVALVAWVQSRGGGDRAVRYGRRMRRFGAVALVCGLVAAVLEVWLRTR
jgi:hypothetical protein